MGAIQHMEQEKSVQENGQVAVGQERMTSRHWLPLLGLTGAAFIFNTSEFIPIGLLTDIAADFHTTEAHAGLIISVYAWVVMLLSLPLMILVSKVELRRLMLWTVALFVVFQALSGLAASYGMLMTARMGVACSHAVFWSIVSPLAVQLAPYRFRPLALSMIVTGTSVAMVFGLPLGRVIGLWIGWRMTFMCIGAFSLATLLYLLCCLPTVPSRGGFSRRDLPRLFRNPLLLSLYGLTLALATACYTGYSYIEPFLKQVAAMPDSGITTTLMIFGGMGIAGSVAFSKFYARYPYRFMDTAILLVLLCLSGMQLAAGASWSIVLLCALWGAAAIAFNVVLQSEIITNSPRRATSVSMAIFSGIYNLGIGCGTVAGGAICTYVSMAHIGYAGGVLALLAFFLWCRRVQPLLQRVKAKRGDSSPAA